MKKLIILFIICFTLLLSGCEKLSLSTKNQSSDEPVSDTQFAFNTFVTITLYDTTDTSLLEQCFSLCREYENKFSRTLESSELWNLNHSTLYQTTLSDDLESLLEKGMYYSQLSDGSFDITIGAVSQLWDFTAESPVLPEEKEIQAHLPFVNYKTISIENHQLIKENTNTVIDLGAIAKGYIADKLKQFLLENGVKSGMINLGGNILCIGEKPDGEPFKIGIQKPFEDRNETICAVEISDLSVVSSGIYERYFKANGVLYHHILNPLTGYPVENNLISVTIISKNSVDGDALSTLCFSKGLKNGLELINSLSDTYAVFITDDYELHFSEGFEDHFKIIS
ncbi:FAD:protein FMN transferase [Anaeromicropila populeti]|uniref:FAD:protein FMN transferase n=1 Tax=Anaeromicropila populeti TaxID=37658 RepID=A0A1I6I9R6_9FIRM|nr:FAD:protein FMN transferase [Anaeromicropila populeti]SFR63443.1 thiamine biosynthesis lipoprotein [Anaeromicropila populeti]